MLVNYRIDPSAVAAVLPPTFRPVVRHGWAVGGLCLIRLSGLRLAAWLPPLRRSESAAHRFAVCWDTAEGEATGVFVLRRDTDAWSHALAGGRL